MPTAFVGGNPKAEQDFLRNLSTVLAQKSAGRRLTAATLVGAVRTKSYPENPIAGQAVRVIFVADVKLINFDSQPIVRDALMTNQAQQLITGSGADGTPVTVEISASGTVTIVGRAAFNRGPYTTSFISIHNLAGVDMGFALGMRTTQIGQTGVDLVALNTWRTTQGLAALASTDLVYVDPQVLFHGRDYYQGYIGLLDGGRFVPDTTVVCTTRNAKREWYDGPVLSTTGAAGRFVTGETLLFSNGASAVVASRREDLTGPVQVLVLSAVSGELTGAFTGGTSGASAVVGQLLATTANTPDWWYATQPAGFGSQDPWYASKPETVCT